MLYRAIGLMSGSSLDGLDIVFVELLENAGNWSFEIKKSDCYTYSSEWKQRLQDVVTLNALDYQLLHTEYGHHLGHEVNRFINENHLNYQVALVTSHGHTSFHLPAKKMTAQLGDGAAIAAETGLPVVSDLRALDVAFGGQGAPIVPIGEKLLFPDFDLFLNLGGIANISMNLPDRYIAFDVCPANRVLNLICAQVQKEYDDGGQMAALGNVHDALFKKLNELDYYKVPFPKSLANDFGTEKVFPLVKSFGLPHTESLRTYVEHIALQVGQSILQAGYTSNEYRKNKMMVTGGGAMNHFLVQRLKSILSEQGIEVVVPDEETVQFKEALIMALIGVLRWRQEYNVLSTVTGASRPSIGGALWTGQEA